MPYRPATGRPLKADSNPRSARSILRRHLRQSGFTISGSLAKWWNIHPTSAYRLMYSKRKLAPQYILAAIKGLKLDDFDAQDLILQAAREAGWPIKPEFFLND